MEQPLFLPLPERGLCRGDPGQGQPLALGEQMVVPHKGGGGLCIIAPVHQEQQLLGGGVQLARRLGAKLFFVLRLIAASDGFHSVLFPSAIASHPSNGFLYAVDLGGWTI